MKKNATFFHCRPIHTKEKITPSIIFQKTLHELIISVSEELTKSYFHSPLELCFEAFLFIFIRFTNRFYCLAHALMLYDIMVFQRVFCSLTKYSSLFYYNRI